MRIRKTKIFLLGIALIFFVLSAHGTSRAEDTSSSSDDSKPRKRLFRPLAPLELNNTVTQPKAAKGTLTITPPDDDRLIPAAPTTPPDDDRLIPAAPTTPPDDDRLIPPPPITPPDDDDRLIPPPPIPTTETGELLPEPEPTSSSVVTSSVDKSASKEESKTEYIGYVEPPIPEQNPSETELVIEEKTETPRASDAKTVSKVDLPPEPKKKPAVKNSASRPPDPKKKKTPNKSNFRPPRTVNEIGGPPTLENLRASAHVLAREGLKYKFGRENPDQGGMDCSGTIEWLLTRMGIEGVPRTSYDQYEWLKRKKLLDDVQGKSASRKLLKKLSPGDLIFWGSTWRSGHKVSHVMIYMGWNPDTKKHYVFGARGKLSKGILGNGVDVFELDPDRGKLIAHGKIPGLQY